MGRARVMRAGKHVAEVLGCGDGRACGGQSF